MNVTLKSLFPIEALNARCFNLSKFLKQYVPLYRSIQTTSSVHNRFIDLRHD